MIAMKTPINQSVADYCYANDACDSKIHNKYFSNRPFANSWWFDYKIKHFYRSCFPYDG